MTCIGRVIALLVTDVPSNRNTLQFNTQCPWLSIKAIYYLQMLCLMSFGKKNTHTVCTIVKNIILFHGKNMIWGCSWAQKIYTSFGLLIFQNTTQSTQFIAVILLTSPAGFKGCLFVHLKEGSSSAQKAINGLNLSFCTGIFSAPSHSLWSNAAICWPDCTITLKPLK